MMKISALNEAPRPRPENDDEDAQTITKEAQEQIALTEYNRALELMKSDKVREAMTIFRDLLETELLDQVEKSEIPEGRSRPMLSLKYSCYKNIGAIQASLENYEDAIENYWEAANLDDTDVTLWYRMGCLATTVSNLELACSAFKQGLKCNPNHWPCLDNIISVLYAVPDYMNCLIFVSMALERDPSYVKGLAFREKIFKDLPYFEECYKIYNIDWALDPPLDTEYDRILGEKLILEAREIADRWIDSCKSEFTRKPLPVLCLNRPLNKSTWLELGESLVDMHNWMTENSHNFVSRVIIDYHRPIEEDTRVSNDSQNVVIDVIDDFPDNEIFDVVPSVLDEKNDIDNIDMKIDIEDMEVMENSDDQRVPTADYDVEMRSESNDDVKDTSNDIQIIEEPSKITDSTNNPKDKRIDDQQLDYPEIMIVQDDDDVAKSPIDKIVNSETSNCEKSNEETTTTTEKSANNEKSIEKTNERPDTKEEGQKVKKRRRSSLCFLQQWAWSSSSIRRSARVRGSNRKEAERDDVQLEETLRRMFPSTLLPDGVKLTKDDPFKNMEDSMDTMDLYQLFANRENNIIEEVGGSKSNESSKPSSPDTTELTKYFGEEVEKTEVEDFINEHSGKSNLMIVIAKYTEFLSTKWNHQWPEEMIDVYIKSYAFTREHVPHRSPFGHLDNDQDDEDNGILKHDAEMTLLFGELHTDRWINEKPDAAPSSRLDRLGTGMPSEELGQIIFASVRDDIFNEENTTYLLRVLWLKANIFNCQGETDVVIETLESLLEHVDEFKKIGATLPSVYLPNCKYNSRINVSVVRKMLVAIRRGQKLAEVQKLHDEKKYAELAATLQDTFKFAKQREKMAPRIVATPSRIDQLTMLLDSLWMLEQYEECYVWSEACLNESWQNYLNSNDDVEQKKWTNCVLTCLEKLESCVREVSTFVVRYLPESRLARLVQNLVQMVCHQLDVTDSAVEMPLETVLPWIVLHYVLQYEEDKGRAKSPSQKTKEQNSEDEDEDEDIPPSIMILITAHEFLGRHSWCCKNDAKILIFTMKLVIPRLRTPQFSSIRDKLGKHVEQIFYCLYGHPNKDKRTKPKYLEDHRVPQIELTWEGAQLLFDFYRPDQLPEFDSPKSASINADTHSLFKKVISLVPEEHDPSNKIDDVTAYIVGDRDSMPTVKKPLPYQVSSVYALLGDYLFKYNQYANSTSYFLMDLCLHPEAFNSWTALAMVMGTEFGTALTSCKPLPDTKKLLFDAKIAQFCYQRAVELVPAQSVIWIEYGTFAYTVHSFCSRLLKQETDTLSMERFEALETRKEDTLDIAVNCFISANRVFLDDTHVHDERWLYHYMLAKIAEKKNEDPPVYLDHYAKASDCLNKNNAHYPIRIPHKNPSQLSVEALEVHYRIHACILKYLEQHDNKSLKKSLGQMFMHHLMECATSQFMQYESNLAGNNKTIDGNCYPEMMQPESMVVDQPQPKSRTNQERRLNSVEEIPAPEKPDNKMATTTTTTTTTTSTTRNESRKRQSETQSDDNGKRIKLGSVSHLQLMQDVVGIIDDLITNVCDIASQRESSGDEITILSSDESEKSQKVRAKNETSRRERAKNNDDEDEDVTSRRDKKRTGATSADGKNDNVQDLMDELMKRAMEISNEDNRVGTPEDEDTRKSDGKWLSNDELHNNDPRSNSLKDNQLKDNQSRDKNGDKKKSHANKDDLTMSRRGSQESTTTTQTTTTNTETNNSSSSSSDESTSSEDSSESDSSSDSDSESIESDGEKKKIVNDAGEKEEYLTEAEVEKLINYCLAGLEQCVLRFPEHYKSMYRLCHYFFNNKIAKDNGKCRDLFLGTYKCQYYPGRTFQGLFADRRTNNFFNGVWRNPIEEIDRPGSFASHMSRCVTLLMQILKETDDSLMLLELYVQLRRLPDLDKKYLRDSEREQLSRQALTLCIQSLRTRIQNMSPPPQVPENTQIYRPDARKQTLLDVYKIYREIQKIYAPKDVTIQAFTTLLTDTYKAYAGVKNIEGNAVDVAVRCCQQVLAASRNAESSSNSSMVVTPTPVTSLSPVTTTQSQTLPTSPQTQQTRKPYKTSTSTGRPRGRPPNVNKYLQAIQQSGSMAGQYNAKTSNFGNYLGANSPLMNPYFMNPLMDPGMLTAVLTAGMSGNMLDPLAAVNYLNQMGNYQDILRQYQSNLSSMTNLANYGNMTSNMASTCCAPSVGVSTITNSGPSSNSTSQNLPSHGQMTGNLTVQQLLNMSTAPSRTTATNYNQANAKTATTSLMTATTTSTTKEAPSVSITPVSANIGPKVKSTKHSNSHETLMIKNVTSSTSSAAAANLQNSAQVSLLKPSIVAQQKVVASPKPMTAPQIRVSKTLNEPQPAHNSSHSTLNSSTSLIGQNNLPQAAHSSLPAASSMANKSAALPMAALPSPRGNGVSSASATNSSGGTSLQHKLLSKKMAQLGPSGTKGQGAAKKTKKTPQLPNTLQGLLGAMGQNFVPPELNGISVSPVGMKPTKNSNYRKNMTTNTSKTTKSGNLEIPAAMQSPLQTSTTADTMSMLTQLQQHSHLEIIPQQKNHGKVGQIDYAKNLPLSFSIGPPQKMTTDGAKPTSTECMSVYELPRAKNSNNAKKNDGKHVKDSVEIITLDD